MKYFSLLFIALLLAACTRNGLEITGQTKGITDGTITLKDVSGETLSGVNIKDGKFALDKINLNQPDYGTITLSRPGKDGLSFQLYLEQGQYTVDFDNAALDKYPQITSKSTVQNQLSAYNKLFEQMSADANKKMKALDEQYKSTVRSNTTWTDSTTQLANQTETERKKLNGVGREALAVYISQNPNNQIAAHIMQDMNINDNPAAYYAVFQKFSPAQKNTEEGKALSVKLNALIHLVSGAMAPPIAGTMPDGKKLDLLSLHKKLILVEFWRAGSVNSRINHQTMIKKPMPELSTNELGIVSVSFDKKRDWWLGSMRDDKLTWPQVSDLKGNDSPNADNWAITNIPTYYLLDGTGHIVDADLDFNEIPLAVSKYLKQH